MAPANKASLAKKNSQAPANSGRAKSATAERSVESPLTQEMLTRFDSRAATYDRENRFFDQDFEELRAAKYLISPLPTARPFIRCLPT